METTSDQRLGRGGRRQQQSSSTSSTRLNHGMTTRQSQDRARLNVRSSLHPYE